jgi:hypothetical protein
MNSRFKKTLKTVFIFTLIFSWIFSGWPQVWPLDKLKTSKIQIPPEIQKARAGTVTYDTAATHVWHSPSALILITM